MATTKDKSTNKTSVLVNVDNVAQSVGTEDVKTLVDVIGKEIGDRKLQKKRSSNCEAL